MEAGEEFDSGRQQRGDGKRKMEKSKKTSD